MRLENLSNIDAESREWKTKRTGVYRNLKVYFLLHEAVQSGKFILICLLGLWLVQPILTPWVYKILWQLQFLAKNVMSWITP